MPFRPRVNAQTHTPRVFRRLGRRRWLSVIPHLWHVRADCGRSEFHRSPDLRVVVFLGGVQGSLEPRTERSPALCDTGLKDKVSRVADRACHFGDGRTAMASPSYAR